MRISKNSHLRGIMILYFYPWVLKKIFTFPLNLASIHALHNIHNVNITLPGSTIIPRSFLYSYMSIRIPKSIGNGAKIYNVWKAHHLYYILFSFYYSLLWNWEEGINFLCQQILSQILTFRKHFITASKLFLTIRLSYYEEILNRIY